MNQKKTYIVGASSNYAHELVGLLPEEHEVLLVNSAEDIPLEDRGISEVISSFKLTMPPPMPELYIPDHLRKQSHRHPYKYHK